MLMSVQSGSATMELVLKDPQRIKIGLSHDSDGSTLGNIPKGLRANMLKIRIKAKIWIQYLLWSQYLHWHFKQGAF